RMQLLTTGRIAVTANGVALDYDYKMKPEHKGNAAVSWATHATSNPVIDIQKAQQTVAKNTGTKPTRLIMNSKTFANMAMSKSIKMDMNILSGENIIVTEEMAKMYFRSKLGINIQVYDKMFKDEAGVEKNYVPDDVVVIIPDGMLGATMFGTTPEESDLMSGTDAQVSIVNTGMAITTSKRVDPVNVETKVSMITLPSFERIDEIYILDTTP
ncbi:MAG: major capsid protein, partial [Bacillota bacterium]|nr:major capsid protein [Bacillota bacterium]